MLSNTIVEGFEWDIYNQYKSIRKHQISNERTESIFVDNRKIIYRDEIHSNTEKRLIIIGKDSTREVLAVIFTIRNKKIRPISSRPASRKERRFYEAEE